ncbi:MAG TPA: nicotinamide mononucleotide transporter [Methanofastidiosum sp.]|nr:nicotinamide mononucleotide transporter [Methanofastidiosum sp.]
MIEIINWIFVGIGMVGTVLNIFKNKWCFIIWGISNTAFIIINIYREIYSMALFFFIGLLTCFWGLYQWIKDERKAKREKELQEMMDSVYTDWADL